MKKPLLAGVGIIGACAACCAVPLALPILSGLSGGTLAGALGWDHLSGGAAAALAVGASAVAAGLVLWLSKRANPQALSCAVPLPGQRSGGCGCASTDGSTVHPS